jgi:hypothetical protein
LVDAYTKDRGITDRDQRRANIKAIYAKIETVLTPAQRTQARETERSPYPQ